MKKVFSVLTVAVLAVSTVFAGLSGEFSADYTADFANESYGFNNGSGFKMTFDATTGSTENEKDVYAKLAGEFALSDLEGKGFLLGDFDLTEASINGENWKVDLTGMSKLANFAGGFAKRSNGVKSAAPQLAAEVKATNGITAVYDGWTVGVGMNFAPAHNEYTLIQASKNHDEIKNLGTFDDDGNWIPLPNIGAIEDSVDIYQLNVVPEKKEIAATFNMKQLAFIEDALKLDASVSGIARSTKDVDMGFGAKVAYAQDKLSASVASDVIVDLGGEKAKVDADVAADFGYDFINAGLYYATNAQFKAGKTTVAKGVKNLLDAKLGINLASFEVPLTFDVVLKDLVNDGRGMDLAIGSDFMEGASVGASFGMTFKTKAWNAGLNGSYNLKDVAEFSIGLGLKGAKEVSEVSLSVAAENTTLIENATLRLEYASENFLAKDKAAGALTASCAIEF